MVAPLNENWMTLPGLWSVPDPDVSGWWIDRHPIEANQFSPVCPETMSSVVEFVKTETTYPGRVSVATNRGTVA